MEFKITIYSNLISERCLFEPFTKDNDKNKEGKVGIRNHGQIACLFFKIFGREDKIINIKNNAGKTIHLNKNSLVKWLSRHLEMDVKSLCDSSEYEEAIKLVLIEQKKKSLTPEKLDNMAYQEVMTLFGGENEFLKLPILDIGERRGNYIDFIEPGEMTAPIMRGKDTFNREFFVIRAKNSETNELTCVAFFARGGKINHGSWVTGLKNGLKTIILNDHTIDWNFDIQTQLATYDGSDSNSFLSRNSQK